jgi:hypothetical protein
MWHAWWRRETHTGFRWVNLKERGQLRKLGADDRITMKRTLEKQSGRAWIRSIWLRIRAIGRLLLTGE